MSKQRESGRNKRPSARPMRANIFDVPPARVSSLEQKLEEAGLAKVADEARDGWAADLWITKDAKPRAVGWMEPFQDLLADRYHSVHYSGVYLLQSGERCFALSFGQAFHYLQPFSDPDFGMMMACRIGDERHVKQHGLRRFGGKRLKEITSFGPNAGLFVRNGVAVDFLKIRVADKFQPIFGRTAEFGHSLRVVVVGGRPSLTALCDSIVKTLSEPELFGVPSIVTLGGDESARFDEALLDDILGEGNTPQFTAEGHELVGVDFIFSGNIDYRLTCPGHRSHSCEILDLEALRKYIAVEGLNRDQIFDIKVELRDQLGKPRRRVLKKCLEYTAEDENVTLDGGRWRRFNEEYRQQLDQAVDRIDLLDTESEFRRIDVGETAFNSSRQVSDAGYEVADKDFELLKVSGAGLVEAYDLAKDDIQYAVKFGDTRDFLYLCAQATAVLEIARSKADEAGYSVPRTYCLWLGFKNRKAVPDKLSDLKSTMLKQRLVTWAQECVELGIDPAVKLSLRVPPAT